MAYFNHAFQKVFIGTNGLTQSGSTNALTTLQYGLYNAKTFANYTSGSAAPFFLASGSIYANDKIGPFHGGYKESNKSKVINPKFINKFYKVIEKASTQSLTIIGKTNNASALVVACSAPEFECGKTYRLRLDIKGSPALRFLNHQLYKTLDAYTGCCTTPATPENVDPTWVMTQWAAQILNDPFLSQFISPVVKYTLDDTAGSPTWVTLTTAAQFTGYTPAASGISTISAGLELTGAYVDTVFGDCSFSPMDHFEKEPIQIYASFVDDMNDPCQFASICVSRVVLGKQGEGYGETVIRDLILSESYAQNYFNDDPRIREITQGNSIYSAVNRAGKYTAYYLLHSVPRFNNPSGTFDNDQYLLKLIVQNSAFTTAASGSASTTVTVASFTGITAGMRLFINGVDSTRTVSATPTTTAVTISGAATVVTADILEFRPISNFNFETVIAAALSAAGNTVTLETL